MTAVLVEVKSALGRYAKAIAAGLVLVAAYFAHKYGLDLPGADRLIEAATAALVVYVVPNRG